MTSDLESAQSDLVCDAATRLWHEANPEHLETNAPADATTHAVEDLAIANDTGVELHEVRELLEGADGVRFIVGSYGDTRTVESLIRA